MRKKKYIYWVMLVFILILGACSNESANPAEKEDDTPPASEKNEEEKDDNFNPTGMPIVNEPITLHFMTGKPPITAEDYNEVLIWQEYEKMTNIHIDWGLVPNEALVERRNLSFVGGEYPDVFYSAGVPDVDLFRYGQEGIIIKLNDLIDEYMPNFKALLEKYPEIRKGITFPDGSIYALPTVYSPDFTSMTSNIKPFIKKDWLDQLGMDVPETTEEFYQYLKAVKETDLNGNGKNDEIPFGSNSISTLEYYLKGSFGVGNRGRNHAFLDIDPETNELRFYRITEEYKELLQYIHKLFSEGLIEQNIFSIDENQFQATGSFGLYGSSVTSNPETRWGIKGEYVGMPPLKGPRGHQEWAYVTSPIARKGSFVITDKNPYPEATARWIDYFYGEEGVKLFFMGVEGVTYEVTEDGEYVYMDHITDPPDGITMQQAQRPYFTYLGGGYPGLVLEKYFKGAESLPSSLEAAKLLEPYMIEEIWAPFTYTEEEYKRLAPLQTDIEKYVNEMSAKFMSGNASFSEWDDYVKTIERMGLEEYMEIQKAAYERYKNN